MLGHYRAVLAAEGWEMVEDDGRHLRPLRDGLAFEVIPGTRGRPRLGRRQKRDLRCPMRLIIAEASPTSLRTDSKSKMLHPAQGLIPMK